MYTAFCSFPVSVYLYTFFPLVQILLLTLCFSTSDNADDLGNFPSPNIFTIAFSFSVSLPQAGAAVHSRPLKSPEKTTKAEAVSATWRHCYQQGQSAAVTLELRLQITHKELHWPQSTHSVRSRKSFLAKQGGRIPGFYLPFLSHLWTSHRRCVGRKNNRERNSGSHVLHILCITQS